MFNSNIRFCIPNRTLRGVEKRRNVRKKYDMKEGSMKTPSGSQQSQKYFESPTVPADSQEKQFVGQFFKRSPRWRRSVHVISKRLILPSNARTVRAYRLTCGHNHNHQHKVKRMLHGELFLMTRNFRLRHQSNQSHSMICSYPTQMQESERLLSKVVAQRPYHSRTVHEWVTRVRMENEMPKVWLL